MTSPPAKRQRTENAPITRSDIWHIDGSVVLQVENTQFRPPDQSSVEGCPVLELQDDHVDVNYLLKALYSPCTLLFPVIAALIRLGRKYDCREVLDMTVERVTFENPTTLEEYDALSVVVEAENTELYFPTRIVFDMGSPFDLITLVRENNILTALPCAYYRAILYHPSSFLVGLRRRDGTSTTLAAVDQHRCTQGREKLIKDQFKADSTFGWLRVRDYGDCIDPSSCNKTRTETLECLLDVLDLWALSPEVGCKVLELCDPYKERRKRSVSESRKKIWDEFPSYFDLPPWAELKNDL
ncbi:hypothetical protein DFH07DRAFT_970766 [Mycena maculata]|uniref:Uncharacterized protein n=1 Tax=Mycena maculata TaxID=230809 RepID=A0AAD7MPS0_9AGAR|nr:hypothetical protein DFH07DRAFT_970766 [Mycena maculata]